MAILYDLYYILSNYGTILEVGGQWDRFALENGGERVLARDVVGRPLLDFITGDVTRMYHSTLLQKHAVVNHASHIPYRCDGPGTKRWMEMRLSRMADGHLLSEHRVVRTEPLVPARAFTPARNPDDKLQLRCSMCNRLRTDKAWQEPDRMETAPGAVPLAVIYTVCQDCHGQIRETRKSA